MCTSMATPAISTHSSVKYVASSVCVCVYESCMISIWSCSVCTECVAALFGTIESNGFGSLESSTEFICKFTVYGCKDDFSENVSKDDPSENDDENGSFNDANASNSSLENESGGDPKYNEPDPAYNLNLKCVFFR